MFHRRDSVSVTVRHDTTPDTSCSRSLLSLSFCPRLCSHLTHASLIVFGVLALSLSPLLSYSVVLYLTNLAILSYPPHRTLFSLFSPPPLLFQTRGLDPPATSCSAAFDRIRSFRRHPWLFFRSSSSSCESSSSNQQRRHKLSSCLCARHFASIHSRRLLSRSD
jgi:hypothetical protein